MCGIAGAAWTNAATPLSQAELERMTAVLSHRGPDDGGCRLFAAPAGGSVSRTVESRPDGGVSTALLPSGIALGHRRLSIIDLGGGHQPMADHSERIWTVFNGEIYNYRELREELQARGHTFRTDSDTEVLIEAYKAFGTDCVKRFRGMFAFAIGHGDQLFLARDRLGQKPLFYREEPGRLLFASELKAILQVDGVPREIDPTAIDDYLTYQYVPHPKSIFRGIRKLPPGHAAVFRDGRLHLYRYWEPPFSKSAPSPTLDRAAAEKWSEADWSAELRRRLTEAVRLRMRSDVPLGAFLSGGIDSTIIAGLMQRQSERPIHTFSIGFPVAAFDEREFAQAAAKHLGTDHADRVVSPDAASILPKLIWHYDEPFADSSAIPTMILSAWTREHVTVALTGDGGDELFCGYGRYDAVRIAGRGDRYLPGFVRKMLGAGIWQKLPARTEYRSFRRRLKRFMAALALPPERRYLRWIGIFDDQNRKSLYTDGFLDSLHGHDSFASIENAYTACPDRDFITRTTCADTLTYLPDDILTKVDIASMAVGLEARSPFLDHHVAELAAAMPIGLKLGRRGGKRILVETFADLLPGKIRHRGKMGFGVPIDHWFRNELRELVEGVLLGETAAARGIFRPEAVRRLVTEHVSGQTDHSYRLWALLVLELWMRTYVDAATVPESPRYDLLPGMPQGVLIANS